MAGHIHRGDTMRCTSIAVLVLVLVGSLCLLATGAPRDVVKVYFTVGTGVLGPASQLWRCNRDGSSPELLFEGNHLGPLAVDARSEQLFFHMSDMIYVSDLDFTSYSVVGEAVGVPSSAGVAIQIDVGGDYVCWSSYYNSLVVTRRADGTDELTFPLDALPGVASEPRVRDVAILTMQASAVENMSWGRLKAAYR